MWCKGVQCLQTEGDHLGHKREQVQRPWDGGLPDMLHKGQCGKCGWRIKEHEGDA